MPETRQRPGVGTPGTIQTTDQGSHDDLTVALDLLGDTLPTSLRPAVRRALLRGLRAGPAEARRAVLRWDAR